MRIDAQAKKEIKAAAQRISNGIIEVSFGINEGGLIRTHFKAPGQKLRRFEFDRISHNRTHLPTVIKTATEIIEEMKEVADRSFRSRKPLGTLGEVLVEKLDPPVTVTLPEPESTAPSYFEEPQPMPHSIKTADPVPDGLPPIPPESPEPPDEGRADIKKIETIRCVLLLDKCGTVKDGVYTYRAGYSDDVMRRLVNPELPTRAFTKLRIEGFGKIASELKPKRLTKDERIDQLSDQVDKLIDRVEELEEENRTLRAERPAKLSLNLNGTRPHP